ncbi:hypothetical protein ACSBR1_001842 [Camellia fascicularis]
MQLSIGESEVELGENGHPKIGGPGLVGGCELSNGYIKSRLQQTGSMLTLISIDFPNDGAWKQFHKQLQHFPMIVCAKV